MLGKKKAGEIVVVAGGGLVGCETALWLAKQVKKVTIVEILPELMRFGPPVPHAKRMMLLDLLAQNKVEVITNTAIHEITDEGAVLIDNKFKTRELKCDVVALALGLESEAQLYNSLRSKIANIYAIGDCKEARRILDAIWDGYAIASAI